MRPAATYWIGITGSTTVSLTVNLNPDRRYLVTGGLILTDGEEHTALTVFEKKNNDEHVTTLKLFDEQPPPFNAEPQEWRRVK